MEEEILKKYKKAHDISDDVLEFAETLVKPNVKTLEMAEKIEKMIIDKGAKPSWPVNFSINEIAAHVTPRINDTTILKEGDLVKVDIGCHIDGYISDRAFTICVGEKNHEMIESSKKATLEALKAMKPGIKCCEVSEIIEDIVTVSGFNTVKNLSGHSMSQYNQHESPSIPNCKTNDQTIIESGTPMAIEVFTTNGNGWVIESEPTSIYQFIEDRPVRMPEARKILQMSINEFQGLPFTQRWIKNISEFKIEMALKSLIEAEAIQKFPPLKEESNSNVAVWEDTKIVL